MVELKRTRRIPGKTGTEVLHFERSTHTSAAIAPVAPESRTQENPVQTHVPNNIPLETTEEVTAVASAILESYVTEQKREIAEPMDNERQIARKKYPNRDFAFLFS